MRTIAKILVRRLGALVVALLAGGLLTAILVRFSPGFDSDERQLDPRLNSASRSQIEQERGANWNILALYAKRVERIGLHGDLGRSASLDRPIAALLRERLPITAQIMAIGLVGGWALAFALAVPAAVCRSLIIRGLAGLSQKVLMCLPAAALAIVVFDVGGPVRSLVALVVCPRVFEYLRNLLVEAYAQPHIVTARAKGLRGATIFWRHVMPYAAPQLLALAGVSVSMAFGAAIPMEALCDLPGVGQLAWLAATARDLPLLLVITFLVTATTQICNAMSDWAALRRSHV